MGNCGLLWGVRASKGCVAWVAEASNGEGYSDRAAVSVAARQGSGCLRRAETAGGWDSNRTLPPSAPVPSLCPYETV